ncbi:hypothetical protein V9T40_010639 [Parthenolecanium corni]|uniref:Uncharacterized protein n=1 Tax=Parthenolecanium corni TaxID=536013 RepID=A0AAN9XYN9_9HEMI
MEVHIWIRSCSFTHFPDNISQWILLQSQTTNLSLSRTSDYKKMNGSLDSMDKSQFNSSLEEDIFTKLTILMRQLFQPSMPKIITIFLECLRVCKLASSIDIVLSPLPGYRTNSSFASRDDDTWRSSSYANNCSTLPLSSGLGADDLTPTVSSRHDYHRENEYFEWPKSSATLLETNFDLKPTVVAHPPVRSKCETLLETNFDYMRLTQDAKYSVPSAGESSFAATAAKSKSQPQETAM